MSSSSSRIYGEIDIDFDTNEAISEEQFKTFKTKLQSLIENVFESMLYESASECGFEIDSMHPITFDGVYRDESDDEMEDEDN